MHSGASIHEVGPKLVSTSNIGGMHCVQFTPGIRTEQKLMGSFSYRQVAFIPFLTAGDPDLASTEEALLALDEEGADIIELGVPYSDPLADGPVIQVSWDLEVRERNRTWRMHKSHYKPRSWDMKMHCRVHTKGESAKLVMLLKTFLIEKVHQLCGRATAVFRNSGFPFLTSPTGARLSKVMVFALKISGGLEINGPMNPCLHYRGQSVVHQVSYANLVSCLTKLSKLVTRRTTKRCKITS
jgi:hypothetical protein